MSEMDRKSKDPMAGKTGPPGSARGTSNRDWWPNQLNLKMLHQNSPLVDPMGGKFNYAEEFRKLDMAALKKDLRALMTDRGTGGRPTTATTAGLMIRMAWHSAGTYAWATAAAARDRATSDSLHSTAGPTTFTSTRPAGSSGP